MTEPTDGKNENEAQTGEMAKRAMARLAGFGAGNGVASDDITLLHTTEDVYALPGILTLLPRFATKINFYSGPAKKAKDVKVFPNFSAMQNDVAEKKKSFQKGGTWFSDAVTEIQHTKDHGWGLHEAEVTFPDQDQRLAATEVCPSCNGAGRHTCPKCRGQKSTLCVFCHGQKEEECYNCFGKGVDPVNPHQHCPICHGRRYATCRTCQGSGLQPCTHCKGQGGTVCPECKGTGKITQEITISAGATMSFALDRTPQIPSGLLRMTDRLGVDNLVKGHADIKMLPLDPYEEKTIIRLQANIPYAELKTRVHGKPTLISVFGKRNILSGVPPYLDVALKPWRAALTDAAADHGDLGKAVAARAIREALTSFLSGKDTANDLRRLYPVGLSPEVATEIMTNLGKALRNATRKSRVMLSGGVLAAGAGFFAGLFLTPLWEKMTQVLPVAARYALLVLVPAATLAAAYQGLRYFTRFMLRRAHPDLPISPNQKIGWTGQATLAGLLIVYISLLLIARPWF